MPVPSLPSQPRPCPVCGAQSPRILHRQDFQEGLLGNGYDVAICGRCGAGYADRIADQSTLDAYYTHQSKYAYGGSGGSESPHDFRRFEGIVDQVAPHLASPDASILDIGCATGGLLSAFKKRGFANGTGSDPSPECARLARELHGVDVRTATLAQIEDWTQTYDLVLMVGVLEHLRDAGEAVHSASSRLNPGGLLYVAVPDVEGLAGSRNAPYQQFSMEHVNFFSGASLDRLLGSQGLAPVKSWRTSVEWSEGTAEPVFAALYSEGEAAAPSVDTVTRPALRRYLEASRAADAAIGAAIEALVREQTPILVWGAGALTRRLLASTNLGHANIAAFVDSSPLLQGKELAGRTILAPDAVVGRTESILIASVAFGSEIETQIRDRLRLANPILRIG
jgi:SAM-dependent methyltransferase